MRYLLCTILFLFVSMAGVFGQTAKPLGDGTVYGIVWDEEHTTFLRAATVAVYFDESDSLIAYRLTNNYGEFSCTGLPLNTRLKLIASFIGYRSAEKKFIIKSDNKNFELGKVNLTLSAIDLKEVKITATPPPVVMKGDTLEFNADAFKLDPNAQTEDLLRALPGITVWADASITVNGREVKSVLVNGKPFFGTDSRIATQNIPKNAVEKIQVYQKDKQPEKLTDSTTEMNIQLKKGKDFGFFGKFSGGYGSSDRYEGDANINLFNKRTQLGLALTRNNVNKVASDLDFILRNSTYKGPGANIEYQSDFTLEGLHVNTAGGAQFQHDFIDRPDFNNNNRLAGSYFISNNNSDLSKELTSVTTLGNGEYFQQYGSQNNYSHKQTHKVNSFYDRIADGEKFKLGTNYYSSLEDYSKSSSDRTTYKQGEPISENKIIDEGHEVNKVLDLTVDYRGNSKKNIQNWRSPFDVSYAFQLADRNSDQDLSSIFESFQQPSRNISYDRKYRNSLLDIKNSAKVYLPNFAMLFFGRDLPFGVKGGLGTNAKLTTSKVESNVDDRILGTDQYSSSTYLTNRRNQSMSEIVPYLRFNKNLSRTLSGRYEKNFSATLTTEMEFNMLNSTSEKAFQNFDRAYARFNPNLAINYSNRQFGVSINSVSLVMEYSNRYPTVQQLAPLTDSVNINQIYVGNINLKPQRTAETSISYNYTSENAKNIMAWSASLRAGYTNDYFTANNRIDDLGRLIFSTVNSNGYQFLGASANFKKAVKLEGHQIQFTIAPTINLERTPNIINDVKYTYDNTVVSYNPSIAYSWKGLVNINISQKGVYNSYVQRENKADRLSSFLSQSEISFSVSLAKYFNISNSIFYNRNTYNKQLFNEFTIWNTSASYRFLKSRVAEIKLSGLDLLGENKGLINYGFNNSITQGSVNALQRYFMVGLSYYPRKFGK